MCLISCCGHEYLVLMGTGLYFGMELCCSFSGSISNWKSVATDFSVQVLLLFIGCLVGVWSVCWSFVRAIVTVVRGDARPLEL